MLFLIFLTTPFFKKLQSGFYIDFFYKKIAEVFIRNIFVYTALFFGEKFMIEVITKKILENFFFRLHFYISFFQFNYSTFFYFTLIFIFYFLFFINFLLIFY